ncbi:MAG TPA: hypothetical protein VHW01_18855, partial [Polyangiaceae bacterium]|nr:hypothetical protein [Polyangiaceae bacterium]
MKILRSIQACVAVWPVVVGASGCSPVVDFGQMAAGGTSGADVGGTAGATPVYVAGSGGAGIAGNSTCEIDTSDPGAISAGGASPSPTVAGDAAGADDAGAGGGGPLPLAECPCTRRPGVAQSTGAGIYAACAVGSGAKTTITVTPEGGDYVLGAGEQLCGAQARASGVNFELIVPPNAVSVATTLTLTETKIPPPSGYVDGSPIYSIAPAGLMFAAPVAINVPYGALGGVQPAFSIYASNG